MRPEEKKRAFLRERSNLQLAYDFILTYLRLGRACEAMKVLGGTKSQHIGFLQIEPELQFRLLESVVKSRQLHECFIEVRQLLLNIGTYHPWWGNMDQYQWRIVAQQRLEENRASHYQYRRRAEDLFRDSYKKLPNWEELEDYDDWEKTPLHREEKALLVVMNIDDAKNAVSQEEVFQWPTDTTLARLLGHGETSLDCLEWARQLYYFDADIYDGDSQVFGVLQGALRYGYVDYVEESLELVRDGSAASIRFIDGIDGDCLKRFIKENDYWIFVQFMSTGQRYATVYSEDEGRSQFDELEAQYHYGFDDDEDW